ncbi:zinc finger protein 628, partial [Clonorchis sinensis]
NSPNAMESAGQTLINQCPICGRTFRHPSRLMRHQKSHTTHRDFKCNICARAYKYSFDLDDHMRKRHADASLPLRKSTREQIHASEQAGHPCPECGKQFKQWRTLRNHRRIAHPGTVNFVCEKCGMSFPRELHLKRHIKKMHEREDKRTCPDCGKSLTHSKNLSRHIKDVHKLGQTWTGQCPVCRRVFRHPSHFIRHQESHTTRRDFKCRICESAYKDSFNLAKHMRTRHV